MTSQSRKSRDLLLLGSLRATIMMLLVVAGTSGARAQERTAPARSSIQGQTEVEGEFQVIHQDFKHTGRYLYYLKTAQELVPLHFGKNPPTHLLTGARVRVRGTRQSAGSIILASGNSNNVTNTSTTIPLTGPLPNTFGAQSILVILVNFQDSVIQPYTVADAQSMFFDNANSFFLENSYRQTSITGNVVGWYTIPESSTTCDISQIATYAQNAAIAAGVNLSNYTRYVYAFPWNAACGFAGASNVGGNPSQSWINGNSLDVHTIDHELGHAFGLWHSHLLDCGANATIGSNCAINEYGDIIDTMGAYQTASPHYNSFQKERLGWLNYGSSPSITTVQSGGTYTIDAYEAGGPGPDALKILKSTNPTTGAKTWYYVEARQAIGFDAFLTNGACALCYTQNETSGVLVHVGTDNDGNTSDLLDMTPATQTYAWWFDPSLVASQSFADPATGVVLTTEWVTSTTAAVNVQFTGAVIVATNQSSYSPGQTVATTATATYGGSPFSNVSVSFTITKANGNVVTGSANTGKNGTATYKLRLTQNDPAGTYVAGAAATIKGTPRDATAKFTVQ
jgi:Gametolysin peptidase M11